MGPNCDLWPFSKAVHRESRPSLIFDRHHDHNYITQMRTMVLEYLPTFTPKMTQFCRCAYSSTMVSESGLFKTSDISWGETPREILRLWGSHHPQPWWRPGDGQGQCKAVCNTFHCYKGGPAEGEGREIPWKCAVFLQRDQVWLPEAKTDEEKPSATGSPARAPGRTRDGWVSTLFSSRQSERQQELRALLHMPPSLSPS